MLFGTCLVIDLQPRDSLSSVQRRLSRLDGGRVVLVLPWDIPFLSRPLDFDLLRREVERRQLEVAIVSADPERRRLARGCGFPAFGTVEEGRKAEVWSAPARGQVKPPPRYWWEEEVELRPRPARPHAPWFDWAKLGARIVIFALSLLLVAGSAYALVPSGVVALVPAGREFTTIVPVSVDPEAETADPVAGVVPSRWVGVEVEDYAEVETTGVQGVATGRATGVVLFTNLLPQDYVVPAGTTVRTSSTSRPIRFRITANAAIPAGGQATAPIEALEDGTGNVGTYQINQVDGAAASAVRVINPEPITGSELTEVRVVTQADYERVRTQLIRQLLDQAYVELVDLDVLEPTEIVLRQSLVIQAVPKEVYTRFVTEQADTVGLNLRLLVSGLAVDVGRAEEVAYATLSRRLPPGYALIDARFELGEVAEEDIGPGQFTVFVTARGYAAAALDTDEAVALVRGRRVADARDRLLGEFPLAEEPRVTVWPGWLGRLPLLPLRISVQVVPQGEAVSQISPVTG